MGTRADFYIGRGPNAEWLGSITWDGYPAGISTAVLEARLEAVFRGAIDEFFASRDDVTLPADGWPWPWEDSRTTDCAYAFDEGGVWISCFGRDWYAAEDGRPEDYSSRPSGHAVFPDMSARRASPEEVLRRSGLIIFQAR